ITMKKFHKLLITTTVIASIFGWNVNIAQAQSKFSQLQLEKEKLDYQIGFAAYAIHRAKNEKRISIGRKGGTFIVGDMKISVTSDITDPRATPTEQYYQRLYSSYITITFLKMSRPLSVTFQPKGSDSYTLQWISYEGEKPIRMCCAIYTPEIPK
ncbi:MAG: hypothetical protein ACKPFK_03090, partial [Dolichospermum sp.]